MVTRQMGAQNGAPTDARLTYRRAAIEYTKFTSTRMISGCRGVHNHALRHACAGPGFSRYSVIISLTEQPDGIIGNTCSWYGTCTSKTYGPS